MSALPQIISWYLRSNLILINLKLKQWRMWPSPFTHPHYWHMSCISPDNAIVEQAVSNVLLAPRNDLWVVMVPLVRVGWGDRLEPTIDATEWTVHQPEPSYDVIRNSDGMVDALEGKTESESDTEFWRGSVHLRYYFGNRVRIRNNIGISPILLGANLDIVSDLISRTNFWR